jgi:hypothetical protein
MRKFFFVGLMFALSVQAFSQNVVINEINVDNPGGQDNREFIELFALPNTSLDSLVLVFFDGTSNGSYNAIDLDGYTCDDQGFFVVGNALAVNVDLIFANGTFQNGADAVALYHGDAVDFPNGSAPTGLNLIDAQVYGTNDAAATNLITGLTLDVLYPGYTQFDETAQNAGTDLTQSRIPDGGSPFDVGSYLLQTLTPGTWNQPPCSGGTITSQSALSFCNNTPATVDFTTTSIDGQYLFIIANAAGNIVATTSSSFDFDGQQVGTYIVQGFSYSGAIDSASVAVGADAAGAMSSPCFSFSTNTITVSINPCSGCTGGDITANGTSASVTVILNADPDYLSLGNSATSLTAEYAYLLTDTSGNILTSVDAGFDFNSLAVGSYQLVGISYEGNLINSGSVQTVSGSTCGALSSNVVALQVIQISSVVINEINADNPGGTDTAEFIELYGSPNATLDGLAMVFYDGASGNSYAAYDLDGYSTDNFGFFVLGNAGAVNVDLVIANGTLQNGADAVAIQIGNALDFPNGTPVSANNLMDAQVYGTNDAAANNLITGLNLNTLFPGYTQFDETAQVAGTDLTQSRMPDGGAAFNVSQYVLQTLTPGTWNQPPCNAGNLMWSDSTTSFVVCDYQIGQTAWLSSNVAGNNLFMITDASGIILDTTSQTSFNFTGWAVGNYQVYAIAYTGAISANIGSLYSSATADICSEISTSVLSLTINMCSGCGAGDISSASGTQVTVALDAQTDIINLTNNSTSETDTYVYALTDTSANFIQWIPADFDFNTLTNGTYEVYGLSYEGVLTSPTVGASINTVSATICSAWTPIPVQVMVLTISNIVINELNADNPGGPDTAEFIEFYGSANSSLDGLTVVLFDGTSGFSYAAFDLDGYTTDVNGFFMIGNAGVASSDIVIPNASIQNGADAIALYIGDAVDFPNGTAPTSANLMDAMVYGTGDATANNLITGLGLDVMIPGYAQFDETVQMNGIDLTQSRVPDGGPAFINSNVYLQELTPNTYNIVILGCSNTNACNFDPIATVNDNSCYYPGSACDDNNANSFNDAYNAECVCLGVVANYGCMNPAACNYNALANAEDGSCTFPGGTCDDGDSTTLVDVIDMNCLCNGVPLIFSGCIDSSACNFNPAANTDDGSCILPGAVCDDNNTMTVNDVILTDCICLGAPAVMGCMDSTACNFDPLANVANDSCLIIGAFCDDGDSTTINDIVDVNCFCLGSAVGLTEIADQVLLIFPNPTRDLITIQLPKAHGMANVSIYNSTGHAVMNKIVNANEQLTLSTESLSSGMYWLVWRDQLGWKYQTFVKQ